MADSDPNLPASKSSEPEILEAQPIESDAELASLDDSALDQYLALRVGQGISKHDAYVELARAGVAKERARDRVQAAYTRKGAAAPTLAAPSKEETPASSRSLAQGPLPALFAAALLAAYASAMIMGTLAVLIGWNSNLLMLGVGAAVGLFFRFQRFIPPSRELGIFSACAALVGALVYRYATFIYFYNMGLLAFDPDKILDIDKMNEQLALEPLTYFAGASLRAFLVESPKTFGWVGAWCFLIAMVGAGYLVTSGAAKGGATLPDEPIERAE